MNTSLPELPVWLDEPTVKVTGDWKLPEEPGAMDIIPLFTAAKEGNLTMTELDELPSNSTTALVAHESSLPSEINDCQP